MRLQTVPARRGALWVRQGLRAFLKRPFAFTLLFATFALMLPVLLALPLVGPTLFLALLPAATLGFMIATRIAIGGGPPMPRAAVEAPHAQRRRLVAMLQLGLSYALASYVVMWLSDYADGGTLEALLDALRAGQTSTEEFAAKVPASGLLIGQLLRFGLAGLLAVPFWHAPALVYWDGHSCAKALFSSTLACWRNRGAFAVYSLVWFALLLLFGALLDLWLALFGQGALFATAPMVLILGTVFYVSLYFTFTDCFVAAESDLVADPA